ncbi:HypC/HybG/HupF family hydrogenase formation chaperone [Candidatus Oleimmundimicrobium sp.]|uniref:HypC/HybG/HupF family hydrogenase formation chaperone n=1 Tax=Candidatus Oleimmundimicrobium sp. TaxID=3060597 RepID=UPI002727F306|nr:HypC/HybG/HupF family hydrogenase formation chaperone [Candidatus Oleimmundimicrobium sp.]MDO8886331.1 HypC/HybG/HupF family hydrogenase formation chaperone [Candidatus Oleimmundimicrobium sp.]
MCLAVPGKVVRLKDLDMADVEIGGVETEVGLQLVSDVKVGEYVLVHAGYAINKIDEEGAKEMMKLFEEIGELDEIAKLRENDEIS